MDFVTQVKKLKDMTKSPKVKELCEGFLTGNGITKEQLVEMINIQLKDNQKARILDENLGNNYVSSVGKKHCKSQVATYNYLIGKK
jgi:polyphosphate kinase